MEGKKVKEKVNKSSIIKEVQYGEGLEYPIYSIFFSTLIIFLCGSLYQLWILVFGSWQKVNAYFVNV